MPGGLLQRLKGAFGGTPTAAPPDDTLNASSLADANRDPLTVPAPPTTRAPAPPAPTMRAPTAPNWSTAKVNRRTRLHTSDNGEIREGKNKGDRLGSSLQPDADVEVDFNRLDPTQTWMKARRGEHEGWIRRNKIEGKHQLDHFNEGDKFFGLGNGGVRAGYTGQLGKDESKLTDPSNNENLINNMVFGTKGKADAPRNVAMMKYLRESPKWSEKVEKQSWHTGDGSQAALDATFATAPENGQVRFLLDDIGLDGALPGGNYDHTATSHELRYLHRNWEQAADKTSFYNEGKQVPAPWLTDPETWAPHKGTRVHDDV